MKKRFLFYKRITAFFFTITIRYDIILILRKNKKERTKWVRLKAVSHFLVKAVMKN